MNDFGEPTLLCPGCSIPDVTVTTAPTLSSRDARQESAESVT